MGSCCSDIAGGKQAVGGLGNDKFDQGAEVLRAVYELRGSRGLSSQLELSLSASNLRDRDAFSKSDPMAVLYSKRRDGSLEELGRTEVILNTLNPAWITKLKISYNFEEVQRLLLKIYDVDTSFSNVQPENIPLQSQQFLGEMECALSEIVTAPNQTLLRELQPNREKTAEKIRSPVLGSLTIRAEEMTPSKLLVEITIACTGLENKDFFTKSDPFLHISRQLEDGSFTPVYKTEVKQNDLNPTWKPIKVTLQQLCNGDVDCPLKIECFNFNGSGRHDLLGTVQTSMNELKAMEAGQYGKDLMKPPTQHAPYKVGGQMKVLHCTTSAQHSFLDYIAGGCELNFLVGLDFTSSNGNPFERGSLHYIDPAGRQNAYQYAISAVGEVLQFYDTDKQFTAWGFGGRPYKDQPVSHCFNLTRNQYVAEVQGVEGILSAYTQAIHQVALAGPTIFGPVINAAASLASQYVSQQQQKYFVLLIITDGVITDLQESINALVRASDLPLSVLIVGVGGADFREMEILDADKGRLKSTEFEGRVAVRDIVQFVPMREVTGSLSLAQMLLAELPGQFLKYMQEKGFVPNQPHSMRIAM